jgi:hypothetical protein
MKRNFQQAEHVVPVGFPDDCSINDTSINFNKQINYTRYKTELCRQYNENGCCKYGDKCQFAHGFYEIKNVNRHPKYKTDFCKTFHSKGFCPYGPRLVADCPLSSLQSLYFFLIFKMSFYS